MGYVWKKYGEVQSKIEIEHELEIEDDNKRANFEDEYLSNTLATLIVQFLKNR